MATPEETTRRSRMDRLWRYRVELGPALFFLATFNWTMDIAVPHAGDAIRAQDLLVGFLWFVAAMILFCTAGLTFANSIRASRGKSQR